MKSVDRRDGGEREGIGSEHDSTYHMYICPLHAHRPGSTETSGIF